MDFLQTMHSHMRWLVLAWLVVTIGRSLVAWWRAGAFSGLDRLLTSGFLVLFAIQTVLGLILLSGEINRLRAEHALTMIVALALSHLTLRWRSLDDPLQHRNNALTLLGVLLLVWAGVARYLGWGWITGTGM